MEVAQNPFSAKNAIANRLCKPIAMALGISGLTQGAAGAARKGQADGDGFRSQAVFGLLHGSRACRSTTTLTGGLRTGRPSAVINGGADARSSAGCAGSGISKGSV